jgi:hypothetical protein
MIDYLDKPPQRYKHEFQCNSGSREMVEDAEGEWVKYQDMDLYMFEGAQGMLELLKRVKEMQAALQAVKQRMHFIGSPAEEFWSPNDDGRTVPDWRKEIALVERALTGDVLPGYPADEGAKS